jgi:3-methyladenine DNA glycosylase/8-oxoguanine DNA glycosylase
MMNLNTEAISKMSPRLTKLCGEYLTADEKSYLFPTLLRWAGSEDKAVQWYLDEKIPACGDITARELCESKQTDLLIRFIRHIEKGGFS